MRGDACIQDSDVQDENVVIWGPKLTVLVSSPQHRDHLEVRHGHVDRMSFVLGLLKSLHEISHAVLYTKIACGNGKQLSLAWRTAHIKIWYFGCFSNP